MCNVTLFRLSRLLLLWIEIDDVKIINLFYSHCILKNITNIYFVIGPLPYWIP
jgi:hypothetical protein